METMEPNYGIETEIPIETLEQDNPLSPEAEATLFNQELAEEMTKLEKINSEYETTTKALDDTRAKLGLGPSTETPPSIQDLLIRRKDTEERISNLKEKAGSFRTVIIEGELTAVEKKKIIKSKLRDFVSKILALNSEQSASWFESGFNLGMKLFKTKDDAQSYRVSQRLIEFVMDHGDITDADLENNPDLEAELEGLITNEDAVEYRKLEKTDTPPETEIQTIGYEGGRYTPESLLKHVENQNNQASRSDIPLEYPAYDPKTQQN